MNFSLYIPVRDDWGCIHNHKIRSFKKYKSALKALNSFDSGHICNKKDLFIIIKQKGKILYETNFATKHHLRENKGE